MASQQATKLSQSQSETICQDGPCEQNPTLSQQASNFLQQTGEQVKNMAQGAADAVKNTLGMNADNADNSTAATTATTGTANVANNSVANPATTPATKI